MRNINETRFKPQSLTVDLAAYASGDLVGGKLTFSGALSANTKTGFVTSVMVRDQADQNTQLNLVLFSSDPSSTTFTNNAALDIADADLAKVTAIIDIPTTARFSFADNGVKYVPNIAVPVRSDVSDGTLYGALISRGTPTFAAATDIQVEPTFSCD